MIRRKINCSEDEARLILQSVYDNAKDSTFGGSWASRRYVSGGIITAVWDATQQDVVVCSNAITTESGLLEYLPAKYSK